MDKVAVLSTTGEVIDAFGGTTRTAELFGVLPSAVSNWRTWDRFPERLHYRIAKEAELRSLTISDRLFAPVRAA